MQVLRRALGAGLCLLVWTSAAYAQEAVRSEQGTAGWYGRNYDGKKTASGERFDSTALTAAHRTLPFGTRVRVQNLDNGRSVVVRINDRGPFIRGRVIDVTRAAAGQLGFINAGTARVRLSVLGRGPASAATSTPRRSPSTRATRADATGFAAGDA